MSATDLDITELAPQNTHHVASEDADVKDVHGDICVSQAGADFEITGEVEGCIKKIEAIGDMGTHKLVVQDPSDELVMQNITKRISLERKQVNRTATPQASHGGICCQSSL